MKVIPPCPPNELFEVQVNGVRYGIHRFMLHGWVVDRITEFYGQQPQPQAAQQDASDANEKHGASAFCIDTNFATTQRKGEIIVKTKYSFGVKAKEMASDE